MRLQKSITLIFGLFFTLAFSSIVQAQYTYRGIVLDESTRQPLTGAHVHWEEGDLTTITNEAGKFRFTSEADHLSIRISYLGFKSKYVKLAAADLEREEAVIYLRKSIRAISPVTVLARKASAHPNRSMDANATVNLSHDAGQFLKDSPNISGIRKAGGFGVDPVLRGFSKNRLMVVMDGVLQSQGACPNRMDPPTSHIQMEQIEEVEILKGPYALKLGPSFGGVINFKSQKPDLYSSPELTSYFTTGYESNINRQRYSGGIKKEGGLWTTRLYGAFASTENYEDGSGNSVKSGMSNAEYTVETSVQMNDVNSIKAKISQNFARDVDYPALMMDMRKDNITNATLTYTKRDLGNGRLESSLFGSYVEHVMDNLDREMSGMTEAVTDLTTETYGYNLTYTYPAASGNWSMGSDATIRNMEGFRTRDFKMGPMAGQTVTDNVWQGGKRSRFGGFIEFQPNFSEWNVVISSRLDYYYSNASDPDMNFAQSLGDLDQNHLGWSASAGFTRHLYAHWTTGFWLGRSERYAGMDELFVNYLAIGMDPYEYVGNPQLSSEANHQVDAMLTYSNEVISIETTLFYSYVTDYISAAVRPDLSPKQQGAPGVKQYFNVDEAALYGFEWILKNTGASRLAYSLSTAYTVGRNLTAHEDLPQIPAYETNLKLDYRLWNNRLIPRLHLRGVAEQDRVSETFNEQPTDGYLITNITLSAKLFNGMQLSTGVNNLFDVTYHEHLNRNLQASTLPLNDPGRSLFVELKWNGVLSKL